MTVGENFCGVGGEDASQSRELFGEPRESRMGSRGPLAIEKIGLHRPFAFDVKRPARLEAERVAERLAGRSGNMDSPGQTISLHARGRVHGVTPNIEGDFVGAEHASAYRNHCLSSMWKPFGSQISALE